MPFNQIYLQGKKMPFVRLLMALIAGILLQWYLTLSLSILILFFIIIACCCVSFFFLPVYQKFRLQWLQGVCVLIILLLCGSVLCYLKNPFNQQNSYDPFYHSSDAIVATVNEALVSKPDTYKANVTVDAIYHNKKLTAATGALTIYFDKTGLDSALQYGSQILFTKPPQQIKNGNNPGAFNYQRYLLFQGIMSQVYLRSNEYKILSSNNGSFFKSLIIKTQRYIIQTIQTYIPNKKEAGVAEALLIGYRNDLDKQLVQSYSNTGVVHIIAISGLHLGMIYAFLLLLFAPFKNKKWYRFVVPVVTIIILWLFTLLAGAVPSILRSAVTFSFIAFGIFINRSGSIYNTLAASAFCLLLFNPFLLWDVGFQLSYTAVVSITLFTKPIYNTLYFQNKLLSKIWLSVCVTLAAQLLTLPIVLYNFHQFPVLFLFTNLPVVFLSEVILFITLFLILAGKWVWLSVIIGKFLQALLWLMNIIVERAEKLPFSLLQNIKWDVVQVWLLYIIIILLAAWLWYKLPRLLLYGLSVAVVLLFYISIDINQQNQQQKLIVYSVPKHIAIEAIDNGKATCFYDTNLDTDISSNSFTLKPGHTQFRIKEYNKTILSGTDNLLFQANKKTILILSHTLPSINTKTKLKADVAIISNNAKLYMDDLYQTLDCKMIVADNNIPQWKVNRWRQACDSLHIRFYSVSQSGAFILDL